MFWIRVLCNFYIHVTADVSAESGTHDELYAMRGRYFEMVQAQALERAE